MKDSSIRNKMGQLKTFYFKFFLVKFFCDTFSIKFLLKLPSDQSCSIHVFYKGRLQSLTKKVS